MAIDGDSAHVRLPSGEVRLFPRHVWANRWPGNLDHKHVSWRPVAAVIWDGVRQRGKAMNPVDHPHGGGEGNQPIGLKGSRPRRVALRWEHVRAKKKYSNHLILKRRGKKKR